MINIVAPSRGGSYVRRFFRAPDTRARPFNRHRRCLAAGGYLTRPPAWRMARTAIAGGITSRSSFTSTASPSPRSVRRGKLSVGVVTRRPRKTSKPGRFWNIPEGTAYRLVPSGIMRGRGAELIARQRSCGGVNGIGGGDDHARSTCAYALPHSSHPQAHTPFPSHTLRLIYRGGRLYNGARAAVRCAM